MQTELADHKTNAENLKFLANLLELALYAPDGEVTFDGKAALQQAARQITVLSADIASPNSTHGH